MYFKYVAYGSFNYNISPIRRKNRNCMLFAAKRNVMIAEWFVRAPTAHVVVRSCRKFEKFCSRPSNSVRGISNTHTGSAKAWKNVTRHLTHQTTVHITHAS
jgi:hypothetical protein